MKTHTVKKGDTVSSIALKYYGSTTRDKWIAIAEANPGFVDPHTFLITDGTKLNIPELKEINSMTTPNASKDDNQEKSDSTAPRLSRNVPEPTSYTGKYYVELPFTPEKDYFLLEDLSLIRNDKDAFAIKFQPPISYTLVEPEAYINIPSHKSLAIEGDLTICAWVNPRALDDKVRSLVDFYTIFTLPGLDFALNPKPYLYINDRKATTNADHRKNTTVEADSDIKYGEWQHLAVTVEIDNGDAAVIHYVNGIAKGSGVIENWEGIRKNTDQTWGASISGRANFGFHGSIDQVQIWSRALSLDEIQKYKSSAPTGSEDGLIGCWMLNEGNGTTVHDISKNNLHGEMSNFRTMEWVLSDRSSITNLEDTAIEAAYNSAANLGILYSSYFPDSENFNGNGGVITLMKEVTLETFKKEYRAGRKMRIMKGDNEIITWFFASDPRELKPRLFLIETYRLSSYLGRYGKGRTVRTFSLLPGEKTQISISSYKKSTESSQSASSIFDSVNDETADTFTNDLLTENSKTEKADESQSWHAEAEGKASWGWGSAKASGGASGSANSSREAFAKGVSNVTNNHASKASAKRDIQVNTSSEVKTESGEETAIQRNIENINVSRALNFIFYQMNQEYITLLHLEDVKVGFSMSGGTSRQVALSELDELLDEVVIESKHNEVRNFILGELRNIRDYRDEITENYILPNDTEKILYYRVNKDYTSTYLGPTMDREIEVPGIIINIDKVVMRTDDILVDAILGDGDALDDYSQGLQTQAVEAERVQNEFLALKNKLLQKIVDAPDKGAAAAAAENYQKVFGEAPAK